MEIYKYLSKLLKTKKMSKREFAQRLISATGGSESLSEKTVYAYLNGQIRIRIDYIPLMCNILGVTEQEVFGFDHAKRSRLLSLLLEEMSEGEEIIIRNKMNGKNDQNNKFFGDQASIQVNTDDFFSVSEVMQIVEHLKYAPKPLLVQIKNRLLEHKSTFDRNADFA
jgi:transcriptional regulator with XRE-family HTH domain